MEADILKTGVVLVDLPGQHDANEARSRVAEKYQQSCSAVLIVLTSARAVGGKALRNFLEGGLKRQLDMDGFGENIIYVCTKSDVRRNCSYLFLVPSYHYNDISN